MTRTARTDEGLSEVSTEEMYREILSRLGEDPNREGLLATPGRVEKSMAFLTKGYDEDPSKILRGALFDEDYNEDSTQKAGSIFYISSVSALTPDVSGAAYQASKRGLTGLAGAIRIEEKDNGIEPAWCVPAWPTPRS